MNRIEMLYTNKCITVKNTFTCKEIKSISVTGLEHGEISLCVTFINDDNTGESNCFRVTSFETY